MSQEIVVENVTKHWMKATGLVKLSRSLSIWSMLISCAVGASASHTPCLTGGGVSLLQTYGFC